ncbi:MAG: type I DNA topoisomerase [bacterium]
MPKHLVIVESPTKAKTISKFLGKEFDIKSSNGHVRDLPKSKIGVDVEKDFEPQYVIPAKAKKHVTELKKAAQDADMVYFATDEDREGEAISWHLANLLKIDPTKAKRITFHEITKSAIIEALKNPRPINTHLVDAQQARRILDRLVGYELSPLLWKKIAYGLSAGRVQSIAVDLIVDREIERMNFKQAGYWGLLANLDKDKYNFEAKLNTLDGKKIAIGKDFEDETGQLKKGKDVLVLDKTQADALVKKLTTVDWTVEQVDEKPQTAYPSPPFITSTLQQEGNRKLGMSSRQTMRTAQRLYEQGFITYMRTDSPNLSSQGIQGARSAVESLYGKEYLPDQPRHFKAKSKTAQEAHEAIRPTTAQFTHPKDAKLEGHELALYDLIWKRTLASQMAEAKKLIVTAQIKADEAGFAASGTTILFPGFIKVYVEGQDDNFNTNGEGVLPKLVKGDKLKLTDLKGTEHETKPPARYTEASLVKMLEKHNVGRPSTYSSIIGTIIDRNYVRRDSNALIPTFTAFAVNQLLTKYFASLVDLEFTSKMEQSLDDIAEGKLAWQPYLKNFYFGDNKFHQEIIEQEKKIDPDASRSIELPHLKEVEVRVGRYGPYLVKKGEKENGDDATHASIPEGLAPADLGPEHVEELIELQKNGPKPIGQDPETNQPIFCLTGRYGPYVQLGEVTEENKKPRRASIPKEINPTEITPDQALKLLSLPRVLGRHPDTNKEVVASVGRFGPYVVHDKDFRSLPKEDDVYAVSLDRALEILAQEKKGRGGSTVLKELGNHPKDGKSVNIYNGRYGPYIKYGRINVSLPKNSKSEEMTLEQALELIKSKKSKK